MLLVSKTKQNSKLTTSVILLCFSLIYAPEVTVYVVYAWQKYRVRNPCLPPPCGNVTLITLKLATMAYTPWKQ